VELIALTKSVELSKDKRVNVYTASKYAFLILPAHTAIQKERGMLTTAGCPIKYLQDILTLLKAILWPRELSLIHCPGYKKG
jgi:hypothetical protein